jgi:hypothetical protein
MIAFSRDEYKQSVMQPHLSDDGQALATAPARAK